MQSGYLLVLLVACLLNQAYGGTSDLTRCPINLERNEYLKIYKDKCLQFKVNDKNHYTQASDYCHNTGGQLLTVKDQFKEAFVVGALSSYNFYGSIWLGLSDKVKEGEYRWVTGEVSSYFHWAFGQPTPILSAVEDCVLLKRPGGEWYDQGCDLPLDNFAWVCEYPLRELPTTQPTTHSTTHIITQTTGKQSRAQLTMQPTTSTQQPLTHQPTTQPTTRPTEPATKSTTQPTTQPTTETTTQPTTQPATKSTTQSTTQSTTETTTRPTTQPTTETTTQPTTQPTTETTTRPTTQPTTETTTRPITQPTTLQPTTKLRTSHFTLFRTTKEPQIIG